MDGFRGIDCLVMNHNEPTTPARLAAGTVRLCGYATQSGSIFLKNITNRPDLNVTVVKDGDTLDLGGKTLHICQRAVSALAGLHVHLSGGGPDSVYLRLSRRASTASLQMTGRRDPVSRGIQRSVPWVLRRDLRSVSRLCAKWADRLAALDVELVAPSHGPMLERGGRLEAAVSQYRA